MNPTHSCVSHKAPDACTSLRSCPASCTNRPNGSTLARPMGSSTQTFNRIPYLSSGSAPLLPQPQQPHPNTLLCHQSSSPCTIAQCLDPVICTVSTARTLQTPSHYHPLHRHNTHGYCTTTRKPLISAPRSWRGRRRSCAQSPPRRPTWPPQGPQTSDPSPAWT